MRTIIAFLWVLACSTACAAEAETIADVRTHDDLRSAPLWTLSDGSRVRVGLSNGGSAAGPWQVLYCLLEREGKPTTQPVAATQPASRGVVHQLGPLRYSVDWDGAEVLQQIRMALQMTQTSLPILYVGAAALDRRGTAHLRIYGPDDRLLAERELRVEKVRPMIWTRFAGRQDRRRMQQQGARREPDGVVADRPFPAMPRFGAGGAPFAATQPTQPSRAVSALPAEIADDPAASSPLQLTLEDGVFVLRTDDGKAKLRSDVDETALARWWVNGQPIAISKHAIPKRLMLQQSEQRMLARSKQLDVVFGLPDFLGTLRAGDRVAVQVLWCPDGTEIMAGQHMRVQKLMDMQRSDQWTWPVLSNRLEFVVTDDLLVQRDHPEPPPR
jgi:hypothetical protein